MWYVLFGSVLVKLLITAHAHEILLFPLTKGFSSHLLQMVTIAEILTEAGHTVTLLVNNRVLLESPVTVKGEIVTFEMARHIPLHIQDDLLNLSSFSGMRRQAQLNLEIFNEMCDCLFKQEDVLRRLKKQEFDLIIADSWNVCNDELIQYLDVPSILYNHVGFFGLTDGLYPMLPSFVCIYGGWSCMGDNLGFTERVSNFLMTAISSVAVTYLKDSRRSNRVTDTEHRVHETGQSIMVVNADFVLEYPRPLMPHVFLIPGLHIDEPKPLATDLANFIEGSAPHGLIVFSLGTQIERCSHDLAEALGRVFGRLRQRVLWKHKGQPPSSIANNTLVTPWFPQGDVLAHPLSRLFITHCGTQSSYEAIQHAVPVLALPGRADQFGNAARLVHRAGMGLQLDFRDLQEEALDLAIHEVLGKPLYKKNAITVSQLQSDQLSPPRERFKHLVNYVIRHKGARHLISTAAARLNVLQFYSVDVVTFLVSIVILVAVILYFCIRWSCRLCFHAFSSKYKVD